MLILGLMFAGLLFAARSAKGASSAMADHIDTNIPRVVTWGPIVQALAIPAGIPWQFALAWIAAESGGNPCAIGEPGKKGPDGNPLELGLFQLYNDGKSDLKRAGITGSQLRAYCVPGTQKMSRKMTPEEVGLHIKAGISLILNCQKEIGERLAASGIGWVGKDYWSAVKLWHALPYGIADKGFAQVTTKLGHAPVTWREFRTTYEELQPRARFKKGNDPTTGKPWKQDGYWKALNNAEQTGSHVPAPGVS